MDLLPDREEHSDGSTPVAAQGSKKVHELRTERMAPSPLLARLSSFLPRLKQANRLLTADDCIEADPPSDEQTESDSDADDASDAKDGRRYVQLDLGLGVFEAGQHSHRPGRLVEELGDEREGSGESDV